MLADPTLLYGDDNATTSANAPVWSVVLEIHFSLLLPLVLMLCARTRSGIRYLPMRTARTKHRSPVRSERCGAASIRSAGSRSSAS